MALVSVLVEDAHPGHDLRAERAGPHLLVVVRVVLVVPQNLHRREIVVATLAIKPWKIIITLPNLLLSMKMTTY